MKFAIGLILMVLGMNAAQAGDCRYGSVSKTVTCDVVVGYASDGQGIEYPLDMTTVTVNGRFINSQKFSTKLLSGEIGYSPLQGGELTVKFDRPIQGLDSGYTTKVNFPVSCNGEQAQTTRSGAFYVERGTYTAGYVVDVFCTAKTQFSRD